MAERQEYLFIYTIYVNLFIYQLCWIFVATHGLFIKEHRLSFIKACGISVPGSELKPTSPGLEGGFFTTGTPGKSRPQCLNDR